jgi:YHS domain-containing protein
VRDPVCGMEIVPAQAAAKSLCQEQTYYFCARTRKELFDSDPDRYLLQALKPEDQQSLGKVRKAHTIISLFDYGVWEVA